MKNLFIPILLTFSSVNLNAQSPANVQETIDSSSIQNTKQTTSGQATGGTLTREDLGKMPTRSAGTISIDHFQNTSQGCCQPITFHPIRGCCGRVSYYHGSSAFNDTYYSKYAQAKQLQDGYGQKINRKNKQELRAFSFN